MLDICCEGFKQSVQALKAACEHELENQSAPMSEHELIVALRAQGCFDFLGQPSQMLLLFYTHYLVMHCLFAIQSECLPSGRMLEVGPLEIYFADKERQECSEQTTDVGPKNSHLSDYYSDLTPLIYANDSSVQTLIDQFWRGYQAYCEAPEALEILGVTKEASWQNIQSAYREKVAKVHPDKGGSAEDFIIIKQAYDTLKANQ